VPTDQFPGVGEQEHVGSQFLTVRGEERREARRADLLLTFDHHLHVAGQLARSSHPRANRGHVRDCARLVVGGAASVQTAVSLPRLERIARPSVDVPRRLHIVVCVQEDGRLARGVEPLADHARRAAVDGGLPYLLEPCVLHERGDGIRARGDGLDVRGVGTDAGDAHELLELGTRRVDIGAGGRDREGHRGGRVGHRRRS
jgi:hypothetical protein